MPPIFMKMIYEKVYLAPSLGNDLDETQREETQNCSIEEFSDLFMYVCLEEESPLFSKGQTYVVVVDVG